MAHEAFDTKLSDLMQGFKNSPGLIFLLRSGAKGRKFGSNPSPYTPNALVKELVDDANVSTTDNTLVFYTVEVAAELHRRNVENVTVTTLTHCEETKLITEKLGYKYTLVEDLDMKFDVILGNPPYQDGTQDGGQNKIYNQISKKALALLEEDGRIGFITPTSVLKKSKRFSLIGEPGLKLVDYTADNHFNVGANICLWIVDKSYEGDVEVICNTGTSQQDPTAPIYDYSKVDVNFAEFYHTLKTLCNSPESRMFRQNNHGPAFAKAESTEHTYRLYKLKKGLPLATYWSSRCPHAYGELKLSIGLTKSISEESFYLGTEDFDVGYMTIAVCDEAEANNIKSFVMTEYFKEHSDKWKVLDGYGYLNALKFLPPFDTSKAWTNDEVKAFLESFRNA